METFGNRIRRLRKEVGLSQNDLALLVGVSKSSINMYERGEREPGFETMEALADYFNVDMDYLYCRSDIKNSVKRDFDRLFTGTKLTREAMACATLQHSKGVDAIPEDELSDIPFDDRVRIGKALKFFNEFFALSDTGREEVEKYMEYILNKEKEK